MKHQHFPWQSIIWCEWRHCQDLDYAQHLFRLVADQPIGWGAKLSLILFDAVAGAALALIFAAPITLNGAILQQFALAGLVIGAARGYLAGRQHTWQSWIKRLESNTPLDQASRMVGGIALLALCGFMIFGPYFWLAIAGLYWTFGGLITWINQSLDEGADFNPEDRRWWFWWPVRPQLDQITQALEHACAQSAPGHEIWVAPLTQLNQNHSQSASPHDLIADLLHEEWVERFIARGSLVALGQQAAGPLQTLAEHDRTPLRNTVLWLLENIQSTQLESVA